MYFLSIVGNQVMAVLNPLLALKSYKIKKIVLFYTQKTEDKADTIIKYLSEEKSYEKITLEKILVSSSLQTENGNMMPVTDYIKQYNDDWQQIAFNIAGGMNFQIAACIKQLDFDKTKFIYPDSTAVYEYQIQKNELAKKIHSLPLPVDVFALQGIPFKNGEDKEHPFLVKSKKSCLIKNTVRVNQNIMINNLLFDNVINIGNELHLLKVIHTKDKSKWTVDVRALLNMAINREKFSDLLHHRIVVLTNNAGAKERIELEGRGKVNVIFYEGEMNFGGKYCKSLGSFYKQTTSESNQGSEYKQQTVTCDIPVKEGNITKLYTFIGRNIGPTLAAITSHRPVELCLLYTPNDTTVAKYKKAIEENAILFNVKKIEFIPVSFLGEEIIDMKPDTAFNNVVNITPGTKNHTMFLSIWAKQNGIPLWSVETKSQQIINLSSPESKPVNTVSPISYLKLIGENVESFGDGKGELMKKSEKFESILKFLRIMEKENEPIENFPKKAIQMNAAELIEVNGNKRKLSFEEDSISQSTFDTSGGIWFEQLTGYLAIKCGANDVQTRVRLQWTEKTKEYLGKKYNPEQIKYKKVFRSDIDVVTRINSNYYIISCKSGINVNDKATADEISAVATIFGRFAIPLFANFQYSGEPKLVNGVYMFGYKSMLDINALKKLFTKALEEKQQTRRNRQ